MNPFRISLAGRDSPVTPALALALVMAASPALALDPAAAEAARCAAFLAGEAAFQKDHPRLIAADPALPALSQRFRDAAVRLAGAAAPVDAAIARDTPVFALAMKAYVLCAGPRDGRRLRAAGQALRRPGARAARDPATGLRRHAAARFSQTARKLTELCRIPPVSWAA